MSSETRLKRLSIPVEEVIGLLTSFADNNIISKINLPPNTRVLDVHYEYLCRSFDFLLENPDWPVNFPGGQLMYIGLDRDCVIKKYQITEIPDGVDGTYIDCKGY